MGRVPNLHTLTRSATHSFAAGLSGLGTLVNEPKWPDEEAPHREALRAERRSEILNPFERTPPAHGE